MQHYYAVAGGFSSAPLAGRDCFGGRSSAVIFVGKRAMYGVGVIIVSPSAASIRGRR